MKKKQLIIIFFIVFLVVGVTSIVLLRNHENKAVPLINQSKERVVYTTDVSRDTTPFRRDCKERGGTFNECGSPCLESEKACTSVCAFTCGLRD